MGESVQSDKIGAVVVVGAGIGGIQASLDLAEMGLKVYLLDKSPTIGGVMAQLDKTFPTNDCSMCILSPKLVECSRHPNIEILTCADLVDVEGDPGRFTVGVRKRFGYVDTSACTGCGDCAAACPVELPAEFELGLAQRKAIYRPFPQAVPNVFTVDKRGYPPCRVTCPAGVNAQGYVALISQGRFKEALRVLRRTMPFAGVCGRVCTHPCEAECERGKVDEPIAIRSLKRFVADYEIKSGREKAAPVERTKTDKVAIVGSGPSGLACAYDLVRLGYPVTVFEAAPKPGGLLRYAIPEYRLPKDILDNEISYIEELGVEVRTNNPVENLEDLFGQGYKAVFLATGAGTSQKMNIPGEDSSGVIYALDFLRQTSLGMEVRVGERVAVVGGGNAAVDAARVAKRMGAKDVDIVYRRSRAEMPAIASEIDDAELEGIRLNTLAMPVRVLTENGHVSGIECIRMELGEPDASGRPRPQPLEGSEFQMALDTIVMAIGQSVDRSMLPEDLECTRRGTVAADPVTLATNMEGVFAGGDMVRGPDNVISAIASGKEAAISISRYLEGADPKEGRPRPLERVSDVPKEGLEKRLRPAMPVLEPEGRKGFDEVELGFDEKAATEEARRCLNCGVCSECLECVDVCQAKAIHHDMEKEELVRIAAGAVLLAPGFDEFDASLKSEYGYGRYANVVTSIGFERILNASGPFSGKVLRPSDKTTPRRIAFIQCVGSRDRSCDRSYCSAVCCTYATKEAMIAREHEPGVEATVFYMDLRTFGKGFCQYAERASSEYGVRYIRARVPAIEEVPETRDLRITYEADDARLVTEDFDLVVLSVGLEPPRGAEETATRLGIELEQHGFCWTHSFSPVATSRPGIYVCGAFSGPKDIPETVTEASGAAADVSGWLAQARGTLSQQREYPPEIDVRGQEPRIGVFVCRCGINIAGHVDVPEVVDFVRTAPNVVYAEENLYTCSQDTQQKIKDKIREHGLNRVVVASCTPRTHEPLFQQTMMEAGLNPYLFEMANIREQCSWVHKDGGGTEKAGDLVRMAVAKARLLSPLDRKPLKIEPAALVVGGGISGLSAALSLAEQGLRVHLVERSGELGGIARRVLHTLEEDDVQAYLSDLTAKVRDNPLITTYLDSSIVAVSGHVGNFTTRIEGPDNDIKEIRHGAAIVATGAQEYKPAEYLYGQHPGVVTLSELEGEIDRAGDKIRDCGTLVMVQCVGSRNDQRPYCSRVCCSEAIKCALKLRKTNPGMNVYVLYRDMMTYGFKEDYYEKARQEGVIFLRYEPEAKPEVTTIEKNRKNVLRVRVTDPILHEKLSIDADLLALGAATTASSDNLDLSRLFKVPLNEDGFFAEAHVKLRPVDFATDGVFLCGLAHGPKSIRESITQAKAAAGRAATILLKDVILAEGKVSSVNERLCSGCGVCALLCPYSAIELDEERRVASVNTVLCKGCGVCASSCRSGAIDIDGFSNEQVLAMIKAV